MRRNCAENGAADNRRRAPACEYAPGRALAAAATVVALAWAIVWDGDWLAFESVAADPASDGTGAWLLALAGRASQSDFCIVMAVLFAVILVYGIGQWIAGAIETACLSARMRGWAPGAPPWPAPLAAAARVVARGSGRPPALVRALLDASGDAAEFGVLQHHVRFGSTFLRAPLRLGVWVFPMLGFLGTVVGISGAMRNLPHAVGQASAMARVVDNLYVAFDTTFIGLVAAVGLAVVDYGTASHWLGFEAALDALTEGRAEGMDGGGRTDIPR